MQTRRTFLAALGAAAAGCAMPRALDRGAAAASRLPRPAAGLQLYTVRKLLARDFEGTLAAVAAMGYRDVELAGLHDRSAVTVRAALERHGLAAPSAHVDVAAVRADWPRVIADAATLGHRWITIPWVQARGGSPAQWQRLAEFLNVRGRDAAHAGMRIAYHNHDFELAGDPLPLELLLGETDPAVVDFELDVYWLVRAGGDPVRWLDRYPGRFRMLHLKDTAGAPDHRMMDVGAGTIDWAAVLAAGDRAGVVHRFVEHDNPVDALATARAALAHLAGLPPRPAP